MIRLGIDCGLTGSIAVILGDGTILRIKDMPTRKVANSKTKKSEVDGYALASFLETAAKGPYEDVRINVERVGPMPKQGVTSVWNFSNSYAAVKYTLEALGLKYSLVTPQSWKKQAGVPAGSDKDYTRLMAKRLFPDSNLFDRKMDNGRSDSYYIAMFRSELLS